MGLCVIIATEYGAGGGVDLIVVFRVALIGLHVIDLNAIVVIQLCVNKGHVSGGQ